MPQGEIIFYDSNGKEVASVAANPDNLTLAPGEQTEMKATVPIQGLIGKYKGFLNVNYGTAQAASVYDTAFFYVLPWQKLLLIFISVVVAALLLTLYLYRKYGMNDDDDDDVYHLQFKFKDGPSDDKDHDINLKQVK